MKPSGVRTSFISRGMDLLSRRTEIPIPATHIKPMTLPEDAPELVELDQHKEFLRRQVLKRAVATIRSKSKTRRLVELSEQAMHYVQKSDAWLAKHERFFRSPVWKLVSDEAIRKAHFKCEYWGCARRAVQVHLLEFPEEHLELHFDWMNRDNILIALCSQHHELMNEFGPQRVVPLDRQFDSVVAISLHASRQQSTYPIGALSGAHERT